MKSLVLGLVLLLAACTGGSSRVASVSPTAPATSPTAPASPTATAVTTASGTRITAPSSLACRLPVTWNVYDGSTTTTRAVFLAFPSGSLTEDATAPPQSRFFDRAFSRWLPVWRQAVSPDGRRYAYGEGNAWQGTKGKIHVVDVASAVDRIIYAGGIVFAVVDFSSDGIYMTPAVPEGAPRGLWLLDPAGGTPHVVSSTIIGPAIGGGAAWGIDFNTADPHPGPGGLEGPRNLVLRFDLKTGASTTWFYEPGASVYVIGFDPAGHPIVSSVLVDSSGSSTMEIWLVTSSTSARVLYRGGGVVWPARVSAVDSHGVWFDSSYASSSESAVWLYAGTTLQIVATVGAGDLSVAGGCIP